MRPPPQIPTGGYFCPLPLPNRSGTYQGTTPTTWLNFNTPCKSQLKNAWLFSPTIEDVFRNATIIHTADMTQPSQSALSKQSYILGSPARDRTSALITLSSQDMSRIRRMLLRWNVLNLLSCPAYYVVHVSLPYSNVLITQAM